MRLLKVLLAAASAATILVAFRGSDLLAPTAAPGRRRSGGSARNSGLPFGSDEQNEPEPVLGYDGMDRAALLEWLEDADLSRAELVRVREYEEGHRARGSVLAAIDDLLR